MSELLRNRFVQAIFISSLFLQMGIWVRNFAVLLFVMEKTNGDAFAISMISVAEFARSLSSLLLGGHLLTAGGQKERWFGVIY